jgi:hypothetical protein
MLGSSKRERAGSYPSQETGEQGRSIKKVLEDARAQLEVGELLASPTFDLHTAMSAREIGDSKMDTAHSLSGVDLRTLSERIHDGEGRLNLTESERMVVMDRLLQMEIGWHDRFLLCQTVYTCVYVADSNRVRDQLPDLYAYCRSVDALCTFLYDAVYSNRVCCDEDVSVTLCGVSLSPDVGIPGLEKVISEISEIVVKLRSASSESILSRIQWRLDLLEAIAAFSKASSQRDLEEVISLCDAAIHSLEAIHFLDDAEVDAAEGFAPTLYFSTLGHAPMCDLQLRPIQKAAGAWMLFLSSLRDAVSMLRNVHSWSTLKSYLDHIAQLEYHGFVRCLMYHLVVQQHSAPWSPSVPMLVREIFLMRTSADIFQAIDECSDTRVFLEQCLIAVQGICQIKFLNRARQHRRLRRSLVDWRNMLGHAFNTETSNDYQVWAQKVGFCWDASDLSIQPTGKIAPMSSWVIHQVSWICIEQLLMGGPLDLYHPQEISCIYWYVSYLMGSAEHAAKEHANVSRARRQEIHRSDKLLRGKYHDVCQMAVDSISLTSVALRELGLLPSMARIFNERKEQYSQRFGFMKHIECPSYQPFDQYLEFEGSVIEFARDPLALLKESLFYTSNTCMRLDAVVEATLTSQKDPILSKESFDLIRHALVANMTALKLLVSIVSDAKETADVQKQYSATWMFHEGISASGLHGPQKSEQTCIPGGHTRGTRSHHGGLALICSCMPKLRVHHKNQTKR